MSKYARKAGASSEIWQVFIADNTSTTGQGLAGLVAADVTAYYHRNTDTTATVINLVTMAVGTFTSSGFKEIDATHQKGWYQFCPPNAALAAGATNCNFHLYPAAAATFAPLPFEVDLDAQVDVTSINGTAVSATTAQLGVNVVNWNNTVVATPATAGIPDINVKNISNLVATGNAAFGPVWDVVRASHTTSGTFGGDTVTPPTNFSALGITAGGAISEVVLVDTLTTYTGNTVQTGDSFARIGVAGVGLTNLGDTRIANLDAAVSTRMATYTQPTGFLAATFPSGTVANTTNITAGTITTTTNLTNAATSGDLTATMKTSVTTAALATQLTEGYAALHAVPTLTQAVLEIRAFIVENSVSGTTVTAKKIDGSTTAETATINSATTPTSITRAS